MSERLENRQNRDSLSLELLWLTWIYWYFKSNRQNNQPGRRPRRHVACRRQQTVFRGCGGDYESWTPDIQSCKTTLRRRLWTVNPPVSPQSIKPRLRNLFRVSNIDQADVQ